MAQAQNCNGSLSICRTRVAELNAAGSPPPGADSMYVSDAQISLDVSFVVSEGETFEQKNGCGEICISAEDCDRVKSADLTFLLCHLDSQLLNLMIGGTLISSGGRTVGFELPSIDDACPFGVSFEVWTKAWDLDQQASSGGDALYWHWVFPRVNFRMGDFTLENGVLQVPVSGQAFPNAGFGNGPGNDWSPFITNLMAVKETTTIPAASCGLQTAPAS